MQDGMSEYMPNRMLDSARKNARYNVRISVRENVSWLGSLEESTFL